MGNHGERRFHLCLDWFEKVPMCLPFATCRPRCRPLMLVLQRRPSVCRLPCGPEGSPTASCSRWPPAPPLSDTRPRKPHCPAAPTRRRSGIPSCCSLACPCRSNGNTGGCGGSTSRTPTEWHNSALSALIITASARQPSGCPAKPHCRLPLPIPTHRGKFVGTVLRSWRRRAKQCTATRHASRTTSDTRMRVVQ